MLMIFGLCRCGVLLGVICDFVSCFVIGKNKGIVEIEMLEFCICEYFNMYVECWMVVVNFLKVVIENYFEGEVEEFEVKNNLVVEDVGICKVFFSCEIYVDCDDFMEDLFKKFF